MLIKTEEDRAILGVPGRAFGVTTWEGNGSAKAPYAICNQRWTSERRGVDESYWGKGAYIRVEMRFDDSCRNGHSSFAITAEIRKPGARDIEAGGCLHEEIARYFPEMAPLIAWHLTSTDGPLHYIANTCYHASDRDHRGLRAGERRQLVNGRTKLPVWELRCADGSKPPVGSGNWRDAAERPTDSYTLTWQPVLIEGEGKERNLDAARASAVWPDAPEDLLTGPREELEAALKMRLPQLIADFRAAMDACGFIWAHERETA